MVPAFYFWSLGCCFPACDSELELALRQEQAGGLVWVIDEWQALFCNNKYLLSAYYMPGLELDQESANISCKRPDRKYFSFKNQVVSIVTTLLAFVAGNQP